MTEIAAPVSTSIVIGTEFRATLTVTITTVMYCIQTIGSIILLFSIHVMALLVLPLSLWSMLMASLLVSFSLTDFH